VNSIGRLGQLYNLSPSTLAGLANVAGAPADNYDAEFAADQQEQQKFAAENGLPPVTPLAPPPATEDGARLYTDPSANSKATGQQMPILAGGPLGTPAAGAVKPEPPPTPPGGAPEETAGAAPPVASYVPAQTIPAHWQPGTHEVEVKRGMNPDALAPGMLAKAEGYQDADQSAAQRYQAAQLNHAADVDAGRSAVVQLAAAQNQARALDAQRRAYIASEHEKLDALNAQANAKVDTDEAFVGGNIGRLGAAIAMGIGQFAAIWKGGSNAAMQIVNDAVNSTIERQKANAAIARGAFADRKDLYRENLQAFGEDRAALATKIQLLDKVAQFADERRAKAGALANDASFNDMKKAIAVERGNALDQFAEKTEDRYAEKMNEMFKPAATVGGAGSMKREGNLVTLPDGTTFVMPSDKTAEGAIAKIQTLDQLQRFNNEILKNRDKLSKLDPVYDAKDYLATKKVLEDIGEQKAATLSKSLDQGVLKDSEYERAMQKNVGVLNGLGVFKGNPVAAAERQATDEMLRTQTERWGKDMRSHVTAAGGAVYNRGYVIDANGQLKPAGQYTGQDAAPTEHLAPNGSKPLSGKVQLPTPGPKTSTLIPQAPRMGSVPMPPAAAPKKKGR
jgi:hypothetical protein